MFHSLKRFKIVSVMLAVCLLLGMLVGPAVGDASAQRRRRHNPQAGKKKAAKRIGIGTAIAEMKAPGDYIAIMRHDFPNAIDFQGDFILNATAPDAMAQHNKLGK